MYHKLRVELLGTGLDEGQLETRQGALELVAEVAYEHLQGDRFRHAAVFQRWRPDKPPADCGYDQLEVTAPYELEHVFGAATRRR